MKTKILYAFSIFLIIAVVTTSCKRKKEDEETPSDTAVMESNDAQSQWDNVLKFSEDALEQYDQLTATVRTTSTEILGCTESVVQETISEGNFIGQITVDFGTSLTNACYDGRVRRGKLIIKYTGRYRDDNTVIQVTTENYYVNNAKVEGRRTVTNTGNYVFNVVDSGADGTGYSLITTLDGKRTSWKSVRTRKWVGGTSTPLNFSDDVYVINGSGEGVSSAGDQFITSANNITLRFLCYSAYIYAPVSGIFTIQSARGLRTIDYGMGECDRTATFTSVTGKTFTLNL
jgi:hypothetical protein